MTSSNTEPFSFNSPPDFRFTRSWFGRVKIRPVGSQDLPSLEWDGEFAHFRRLYREIFQSTVHGKALMWVADLPGAGIIGQLFIQLDSARKELADGVLRAYLYGFRIKPAYRGYGVGSQLLLSVEADLVRRRQLWATLNVARQNLDARRFYERHGYRVVADEAGRWSFLDDQDQRHDVCEPAWRMEKKLGTGKLIDG